MFSRAIIDFDDTLFNTQLLKEDIASVFQEFGVGPQIFWESYKEARDNQAGKTLYTFERQLQILNKDYIFVDIDRAKQRLSALFDQPAHYVFSEASAFLSELKNRGADLILLSLGEENFQFKKLEKSGLAPFFSKIFLVNDSKLNVLPQILTTPGSATFLINDKVKETKEIFKFFPALRPILKTRKDVPISEYQHSGLPYFNTLTEILTYLDKSVNSVNSGHS